MNHQEATISIDQAAERLGTNRLVIEQWIDQGRIATTHDAQSHVRILEEPFERMRAALTAWRQANALRDEEGQRHTRTVDVEAFWRTYNP